MNYSTRILLMLLALTTGVSSVVAQADRPNILMIMADDVGWASLSSYHQGLKSIRTPNLDRLAAEGMRFTDYYSQPSCTAGRSAFLTGQFPVRSALHTVGLPGGPAGLSKKDPTIAEMLKPLGWLSVAVRYCALKSICSFGGRLGSTSGVRSSSQSE